MGDAVARAGFRFAGSHVALIELEAAYGHLFAQIDDEVVRRIGLLLVGVAVAEGVDVFVEHLLHFVVGLGLGSGEHLPAAAFEQHGCGRSRLDELVEEDVTDIARRRDRRPRVALDRIDGDRKQVRLLVGHALAEQLDFHCRGDRVVAGQHDLGGRECVGLRGAELVRGAVRRVIGLDQFGVGLEYDGYVVAADLLGLHADVEGLLLGAFHRNHFGVGRGVLNAQQGRLLERRTFVVLAARRCDEQGDGGQKTYVCISFHNRLRLRVRLSIRI